MIRIGRSKTRVVCARQKGAVLVMVVLTLTVFLGFAALALDIGRLVVTKNELQNAADAGALAGARELITQDGQFVDTGANSVAYEAAVANQSANSPVEVDLGSGDVQRGHWSFTDGFTARQDVLFPVDPCDYSEEDLVNAVRVKVRRETTPVQSFFAGVFGINDYVQSATAVAYLGYGVLEPSEEDQPIVICEDSVLNVSGEYPSEYGRMFGNGDQILSDFGAIRSDWNQETGKSKPWKLYLPVASCPDYSDRVGAVAVHIVWISDSAAPDDDDYPTSMEGVNDIPNWSSSDPSGETRWQSFVSHFNLRTSGGSLAPYELESIYFVPSCEQNAPRGKSGGKNFGVLAKYPVLVD